MSTTEKEPAKLAPAERRSYRQIVAFMQEQPWAIQLSVLCIIRELVISRLNGVRMSEDEMLEAIGGRRGQPQQQTTGAVAIVPLRGVLVPHGALMGDVSNPGTGLDSWLEMFQSIVADPKVSDIVLDVDSPGGSAGGVTEAAAIVRAARAKKNIVSVANCTAASAAYAIACQATTFMVTPSGMVGSIGVYNIHEDISAALEMEGVKPTIIQAPDSGYKTETSPFGPLSDDALAHMQEMVNAYYETFVNDVAAGRNVDPAVVKQSYGQGRLLTAKVALSAGLVDGVMPLDQVVNRLLAGKPLTSGGSRQEALGVTGALLELPAAAAADASVREIVRFDPDAAITEALRDAALQEIGDEFADGLGIPAAGLSPTAAGMYCMRISPTAAKMYGIPDALVEKAQEAAGATEAPAAPDEAPEAASEPEEAAQAPETASAADDETPAAEEEPPAVAQGAIPVHSTSVVDKPWDGPGAVAMLPSKESPLRAEHAWVDSAASPDAKGSYKLPHHEVSDPDGKPGSGDETVGAANINGVQSALDRLDQANTQIPEADKAAVRAHLQRHKDDFKASSSSSKTKPAAAAAITSTHEGGKAMDTVSFTDGRPPTLEELAATREMHKSRMGELNAEAAGRLFAEDEQREFDELQTAIGLIDKTTENLKERTKMLASIEPTNGVDGVGLEGGATGEKKSFQVKASGRVPDNIFDVAAYRGFARSIDELPERWEDGARRANELLMYETDDQDRVRGFVERLLKKDPSSKPSESFSHRLLLTGNPAYEAAFGKKVMGRQLSQSEEHLIRMAVSDTGLGNELPVPVTIDPTVILTSAGSTNPLRRMARSITITGPKWRGIASEGVTVEYEAELTEVADQTPSFVAPEAEVAKAHGWVEFSIEVDQDWGAFRGELSNMFADARDNKEANKFLYGTGADEPEGLIFALIDDGGSIIQTAANGTVALDDVEHLTNELPPRFDQGAEWLGHKAFYSLIRGLAAAEGTLDVWLPLSASPSSGTPPLIGYPTNAASEVSKRFTAGDDIVAVLGDFKRGFAIIDRIGLNVQVVDVVMGENRRPKGSRGLYVFYRNTSKLLAPNAFRALQIAE